MSHPFHVGRDARYTGRDTVPDTSRAPVPAAALVLHYLPVRQFDPLFGQLDAHPEIRDIREVRLMPLQVVDFYAWNKPE